MVIEWAPGKCLFYVQLTFYNFDRQERFRVGAATFAVTTLSRMELCRMTFDITALAE